MPIIIKTQSQLEMPCTKNCRLWPGGKVLAGPIFYEEGILYADLDMEEMIREIYEFDIPGHYNRPDVFSFRVNEGSSSP